MSDPGRHSKNDRDNTSISDGVTNLWKWLIGFHIHNDTEEGRLSRLLHGMLLIILLLGIPVVVEYSLRIGFRFPPDLVPIGALILLALAFLLNRQNYFKGAVILSIATIILTIFVTLWLQADRLNISILLFYLVVPVLLSEFFLSLRGYTIVSLSIITGILLFTSLDREIVDTLIFMIVFCSVVGLAGYYRQKLEYARREKLLSIERHHARQMELLNSITHASLNASTFQEMTQLIAERMGELLEADGAFLTLWDEAQNKAIPAAAYGTYRQVYPNMKFDASEKTLTSSVLEAGHPLIIEDVFNTPYMSRSIAERFSTRSLLALPLIIHEVKVGAALIGFDQPHRFLAWEVNIGERAAAQIALAIYKSHLIDVSLRQVSQLELLSVVGSEIVNSLDETEILERALEAVVKKFGYAEATISLLINEDILEVAAISGTQDFGYRAGFQQKVGKGIIGHVAETRAPHISGDVSQDPYYFSTAKRNGSALSVPMLDKENLLGVIYVETIRQNDFKTDDVQTLQTLANQVATSIQKARLYASIQEHLQAMTTLQSISQVVSSSLERDEILHNVVRLLKENFGYTYIGVYLLHEDQLLLGAQVGYPEELIIYDIPITSGITGRTVVTKQTQFLPDVSQDPSYLRASSDVKSEICIPLLKNDTVLGVLNVESTSERPLNENDLNLLSTIAGAITIAIDNARLHAQVKTMAITDAVSGLYNRHAFEEMLMNEIQRATRYGYPLSLIIFDVDTFKDYNDKWGHPAGDQRLRGIADLIRWNQRKHDIAARYGGDEFAIILPNTNKQGAYRFAKRLLEAARNSTPEKPADGKGVPGYTLSMGFATFPQDGDTLATLLLAADQAELTAKRLGKNQIAPLGNNTGYEPTSTLPHHDPDP